MAKVLISLISDQTIPNVLFLKEYENKVSRYIFITTNKMEQQGKLSWILNATGIQEEQYQKAVVIEDELISVDRELNRLELNYEDEYILNLTGGTKIMSIGVYNYFLHRNSEIYYIPIGKNISKKIFPPVQQREFPITYRTDLITYLISYGIDIINPNEINILSQSEEFTQMFFARNYSINIELRNLFNHKKSTKRESCIKSELPNLFKWLEQIDFPFEQKNILSKEETFYLSGGWLEEYTYSKIKAMLNLSDKNIGLNIKIKRQKVSNEFDVMFVLDNAIYVLECKTGLTRKDLYEETVYKLAALRKDFGLFVNSYIVTMTEVRSTFWKDRAALFNIRLIDNLKDRTGLEPFEIYLRKYKI
jgi:hypothetical protein